MQSLLKSLPFRERSFSVQVGNARVEIRPFQILVWLTICGKGDVAYDVRAPLIPAIFDAGFNGTFCIRDEHLRAWAGLDRRQFPVMGASRTNRGMGVIHRANIWLHRNVAETVEPARHGPFRLELHQGMLVFPASADALQDDPRPRLPLLGMQALHRNDLRLLIDFKRERVNLKKPFLFFASFGI